MMYHEINDWINKPDKEPFIKFCKSQISFKKTI
jgi:hypothetical protein